MDKLEYQSIEKLEASNYNSWCDDVRVILLEKDCWGIVQGTETPPAEVATAKEVKDYKLRKSRAYSIIYLNTDKSHRSLISDTEDANQVWEKLKLHFRPESRARAVALTGEFSSCRIQEGETIAIRCSSTSAREPAQRCRSAYCGMVPVFPSYTLSPNGIFRYISKYL
ncbi:hypothetical protein AVEN_183984-1 [Araneus ventricosus]|uniref:DUF4219 domain-containing protein n=1 Tax=Araneus ventricosus TaxID=182803 RepID=A0A4Y2E2K9_ARAVE|nr:hypothetical protein AVEN_183984-1 [Araneus ventricosus]